MESIKKAIEFIKELLTKRDKKKIIENSIIVLIIGAIIIIASGSLFKKKEDTTKTRGIEVDNTIETSAKCNTIDYNSDLEKNLASILTKIEGAGEVDVMITYIHGSEIVPAYEIKENENESTEKDSAGGARSTIQHDYESKIAYQDEQGGIKRPIVIKNTYPTIKGVVVVAEGANSPIVKEQISRAVQVLMDLPIHKVQVFERTK